MRRLPLAAVFLACALTPASALNEEAVTAPFRLADYVETVAPMDVEGIEDSLANILERHYRSSFGGPENWAAIESFKFDGRLSMADGRALDFVALKKKPALCKVELTGPTGEKLVMGYDGRDAWQLATAADPAPVDMPGGEALNFIRDAVTSNHLLYPKLPGKTIRLTGSERVGEELCYLLEVRLPNGQTIEYALDAGDFTERRRRVVNAQTGLTETILQFDHERIERVAVARRSELYVGGEPEHTILLESVRMNTGVTRWMFSRDSAKYLAQPAAGEVPAIPETPDTPFGTRFQAESPFDAAMEEVGKDREELDR